jgi:hypothetical protein
MSRKACLFFLLAGMGLSVPAQTATNAGSAAASNASSVLAAPPQPPPRSPIDLFRELLSLNPADRAKFIATRPPEYQKPILAKIQEYEHLGAEQRELRFWATELGWYLLRLMETPLTNRAAMLAQVPPDARPLVEGRLRLWDQLPPERQNEFLANQATVRSLQDFWRKTRVEQQQALDAMPGAEREQLENGIRQWQALPEEQRHKISQRFNQYFELTPQEKEKALRTLSDPERRQIEKTLKTFGTLTTAQRAQCLRSFDKFASLSNEERRQFLRDAEQWKLMSPSERQAWKDIVYKSSRQPPMPPGMGGPPIPRSPSRTRPGPDMATNGN